MPLQNRVDPFGNLIRTPARGTMMGNRGGALHNASQEIVRSYKSRRWITCALEFRGRHREVMSPHRYTELFFLDEAVAFRRRAPALRRVPPGTVQRIPGRVDAREAAEQAAVCR